MSCGLKNQTISKNAVKWYCKDKANKCLHLTNTLFAIIERMISAFQENFIKTSSWKTQKGNLAFDIVRGTVMSPWSPYYNIATTEATRLYKLLFDIFITTKYRYSAHQDKCCVINKILYTIKQTDFRPWYFKEDKLVLPHEVICWCVCVENLIKNTNSCKFESELCLHQFF